MKRFLVGVVLTAMVVATGCIDTSTVIVLNEDGSGSIVETTYMSAQASAMMSGMMPVTSQAATKVMRTRVGSQS